MGDDPPPLDADPAEIDDYWTETTTISVPRIVKENLDKHRDGRPWGEFLERLRREHADPITLNDAEEIADVVSDRVDGAEMDADELAATIAERFDYAELANRTADEVTEAVVKEMRG
jgi:hypothetical protein